MTSGVAEAPDRISPRKDDRDQHHADPVAIDIGQAGVADHAVEDEAHGPHDGQRDDRGGGAVDVGMSRVDEAQRLVEIDDHLLVAPQARPQFGCCLDITGHFLPSAAAIDASHAPCRRGAANRIATLLPAKRCLPDSPPHVAGSLSRKASASRRACLSGGGPSR